MDKEGTEGEGDWKGKGEDGTRMKKRVEKGGTEGEEDRRGNRRVEKRVQRGDREGVGKVERRWDGSEAKLDWGRGHVGERGEERRSAWK